MEESHLCINLFRLFIYRGQVNDIENIERVDWTTLQIVEPQDDEGWIEIMSESQMCELLGIGDESAPNTAIPTNDEQRPDNAVG